jgi:histidine ammonia-lyase
MLRRLNFAFLQKFQSEMFRGRTNPALFPLKEKIPFFVPSFTSPDPPSMQPILLNGQSLTIEQVCAVARRGAEIRLCDQAMARVADAHAFVQQLARDGAVVYGVTTGFGQNANRVVREPEKALELQRNLVLSHAVGVGRPLPHEAVRAMMAIRINTLLIGHSGVAPATVRLLAECLCRDVLPVVPSQGSVGASGDLCPLAHIALLVLGEGPAEVRGPDGVFRRTSAAEALVGIGASPVRLSYKEGLALINGTTMMAALGCLAVDRAEKLLRGAVRCGALAFEALCARGAAFDKRIHEVRRHKHQRKIAKQFRTALKGSSLFNIPALTLLKRCTAWRDDHEQLFREDPSALFDELRSAVRDLPEQAALVDFAAKKFIPQDAYSVRCSPQVLGASRQAVRHAAKVIAAELNAAVDNPLLFLHAHGSGAVLSGGNFHGQPLALALDHLKLAVAEIGNLMERQLNKLQDPATNDGLPAFLALDPGLHSGMMITQYVAAGLVSENKVLVHPASADSVPTSANQEDHVSMGSISARTALEVLDNAEKILALLALNAAQAFDLRARQLSAHGISVHQGQGTGTVYRKIRDRAPFLEADRLMQDDILAMLAWVCGE